MDEAVPEAERCAIASGGLRFRAEAAKALVAPAGLPVTLRATVRFTDAPGLAGGPEPC